MSTEMGKTRTDFAIFMQNVQDTEYVEEATGVTYYLIDIENSEIDVKIRADGQILD